MKTLALNNSFVGGVVTLELTEFELISLAALVEEGRGRLGRDSEQAHLHAKLHDGMSQVADEFCSLIGHLELLTDID